MSERTTAVRTPSLNDFFIIVDRKRGDLMKNHRAMNEKDPSLDEDHPAMEEKESAFDEFLSGLDDCVPHTEALTAVFS
jgi:hypothetical protein